MSLSELPPTVLLTLSLYLSPSSLRSLHATNHNLSTTLTPAIHSLATHPSLAPIALHYAAIHANEPLIRHILCHAPNLRIHASSSHKPLHDGPSPSERLVPLLLDPAYRPKLTLTDRHLRGTPLHWAARHGSGTITRTLLATGARVDAAARNGGTALGWAAYNGSAEVIAMLLGAGADFTLKDRAGQRPLHYALAKGKREAVDLLKEAGRARAKECGRRKVEVLG